MKKYIEKPVVREVVQWNGSNMGEISELITDSKTGKPMSYHWDAHRDELIIETPKAKTMIDVGDYVIKWAEDEFESCAEDFFHQNYEAYPSEPLEVPEPPFYFFPSADISSSKDLSEELRVQVDRVKELEKAIVEMAYAGSSCSFVDVDSNVYKIIRDVLHKEKESRSFYRV